MTTSLPIARCRSASCRAKIVWAKTAEGKAIPVDAEPIIGGNIVLTSGNQAPAAQVLGMEEVAKRQALGLRLFVSHFTTCPEAKNWRK